MQAVLVTAPVKSSAYQTKRVSVEVKLQSEIKGSQRVLPELSVFRQVSPRLGTEQRLAITDEVTFPLKQKSETSRIAKLKKKFKKTFFHSSSKDRGMEGRLPPSPELAWEQQIPSDSSSATKMTTTTVAPTASSTTAAGSEKKKPPRRHSHDHTRRGTVKHNIRRTHTFSVNTKSKSTSNEVTDV